MKDFNDYKNEFTRDNLPAFFAGEMDNDIAGVVWQMTSDECKEFSQAAQRLYMQGDFGPMFYLLERLAIEWLAAEAHKQYAYMRARAEDDAGEDEAFYQMNR